MRILDAVYDRLRLDPLLIALAPGGIWTGIAPGTDIDAPESQPPGQTLTDYVVITPITSPKNRTSTGRYDRTTLQFSTFTHDPGDGKTNALDQAQAIIGRIFDLLEEAEPHLLMTDADLVGVTAESENYLAEDDAGWQGVADLVFTTERVRMKT